jgi:membrane associated rhomboid family serine protease
MVMLPLYDVDPAEGETRPYVTYGIIAVCVAVSCFVLTAPAATYESLVRILGVIPAAETRTVPNAGPLPVDLTLVTSMFLHRDWEHLAGNMVFFWIFADNVEDAIGHVRFLLFYVLCGIAGGLAFIMTAADSMEPLMGASGAIAGVMTAYMMLRPCARVEMLLGIWPASTPAWSAVGLWIVLQLFQMGDNDGVAYMAHFGGAAAGALLILILRPHGVELFDCQAPEPAPAEDDATR